MNTTTPPDSSQTPFSGWFTSASEISPGGSAILGDNRFAFFAIHHTALCTITISFVASLIVIFKIYGKWKESKSKLDLAIRFPLYLAIAEALWGISHFSDHLYLVTTQIYPITRAMKEALSINLWFFFGYQQMMHASVAGYTYLRVVHGKNLNLGRYEWKLHLLWCCFLIVTILLFHFVGCFGNSGYWMMHDATTSTGRILGIAMAVTSTANALCTTLGYSRIKKKVNRIKSHLNTHRHSTGGGGGNPIGENINSIASQCLATYVWMAACLYCPLALLLWINILFQVAIGVVEPLSSWLLVIVANSSGWANAYAYFHNEDLKLSREMQRMRNLTSFYTNSTNNKSQQEEDSKA